MLDLYAPFPAGSTRHLQEGTPIRPLVKGMVIYFLLLYPLKEDSMVLFIDTGIQSHLFGSILYDSSMGCANAALMTLRHVIIWMSKGTLAVVSSKLLP